MTSDNSGPTPTDAMIEDFEVRTRQHIERVAANLIKLHEATEWGAELVQRAKVHDASKYGPNERLPYIWMTEFHRCRRSGIDFAYPPGMKDQVDEAIRHHVTTNRHHPDFHPDAKEMNDIDLVEMVCDWTAMAQEFGERGGSAKDWADKQVGNKWKFDEWQVKLIYDTIDMLDRLNGVEV